MEDGSIDAGLYVLELLGLNDLSRADIAFICGCNADDIRGIEKKALKKLKVEFERRLDTMVNMEIYL